MGESEAANHARVAHRGTHRLLLLLLPQPRWKMGRKRHELGQRAHDAAAQVPHDGSGDGGGLKFIIWAAGDTPWVCDALSLNCRRTHARTRSGPYSTLPAFFLLQIQISKAHFLILRALCPTMLMGQSILDVPCPSRHSSCVERHDEMSGQLSTTIASGAFSRCTPRARPPDPCSAASAPAESQKCTARARYDGRTDGRGDNAISPFPAPFSARPSGGQSTT